MAYQRAEVAMKAFAEGRLHQKGLTGGGHCQIRQGLRFQLAPVSLPMTELMGDDVRLENVQVPKDCHVPREHVACSKGERENQHCHGEIPHLCARLDSLARDRRDVAREMPIYLYREFSTCESFGRILVIQTRDENT